MKNVGGVLGARRSAATGRFSGRFEYTEQPLGQAFREYVVNRTSDGRTLGVVQRQPGTSWWTSHPVGSDKALPGRQSRREWAADALDAYSQLHTWCACGVAVGSHDRPTRAAMRAWARARDYVDGGPAPAVVEALAWQAAWHARFRGRHYDLTTCVNHARQFAEATPFGQVRLVVPDQAPAHVVRLWTDEHFGTVSAQHALGGSVGQRYDWPNLEADLQQVRDLYEARGYRPVYDWRS